MPPGSTCRKRERPGRRNMRTVVRKFRGLVAHESCSCCTRPAITPPSTLWTAPLVGECFLSCAMVERPRRNASSASSRLPSWASNMPTRPSLIARSRCQPAFSGVGGGEALGNGEGGLEASLIACINAFPGARARDRVHRFRAGRKAGIRTEQNMDFNVLCGEGVNTAREFRNG